MRRVARGGVKPNFIVITMDSISLCYVTYNLFVSNICVRHFVRKAGYGSTIVFRFFLSFHCLKLFPIQIRNKYSQENI